MRWGLLSLVLIYCWTTCNITPGTAWDTVPTYENIRHQQQQPSQAFTTDMPAKLNSSQLHRLAGIKACNGCCCQWHIFSYLNPGITGGYVAGSLAACENQALTITLIKPGAPLPPVTPLLSSGSGRRVLILHSRSFFMRIPCPALLIDLLLLPERLFG